MVPGSTLIYGSNFWSTTLWPRLLSSIPSAAALVPLPMDETTPPVTKIYLVSLIYTPKKKAPTPLLRLPVGKGEEKPVARRGLVASRKPLLRHTCMDLYHTTSGAKMKQRDLPVRPGSGPGQSCYSAALLSEACPDGATKRRAPVASSPARPLPAPPSHRPGPSRPLAWRRNLPASYGRRISYGRPPCLKTTGPAVSTG